MQDQLVQPAVEYEKPIATVDIALFTLVGTSLQVAVQRRRVEPYKGQCALVGGYVHVDKDEDTRATARRVLQHKAGLDVAYLEQLSTFSGALRDPRGWSLSIAYMALVPETRLQAANALELYPVDRHPDLPFDHGKIISAGVERLRSKSLYSSLPAFVMPEEFTLTELQRVYEIILGQPLDKAKFRRRLSGQSFIETTGKFKSGSHRPAELFRLASMEWKDLGHLFV